MYTIQDGKRNWGRPKLRWRDLVKEDMARNQMTTEMAEDRKHRHVMIQAGTLRSVEADRWDETQYNLKVVPTVRIQHVNNRCHGLRVYPVCVCNTVRLGQDTTWNRQVYGLRVYPVCVCNTVRLELFRMDSVTIKPSHSIRCVYRADLILLQIVDWSSKEVCPTILINKSEDNLH